MNPPPNKWRERLEFTLLLLVLTVLAHRLYGWAQSWVEPADPYKVPEGRAEKVIRAEDPAYGRPDPADRLRLFYWYGE
jgi:hypothetical protein